MNKRNTHFFKGEVGSLGVRLSWFILGLLGASLRKEKEKELMSKLYWNQFSVAVNDGTGLKGRELTWVVGRLPMLLLVLFLVAAGMSMVAGCGDGSDDTNDVGEQGDVGSEEDGDDTGGGDAEWDSGDIDDECVALETDYTPSNPESDDETWPACLPDENPDVYPPFESSISSIARVGAFEEIADVLWRRGDDITVADFVDARFAFVREEGLDSRIARREDEHYPGAQNQDGEAASCTTEGIADLNPERCVGPAQILPLLNQAFVAGGEGTDLKLNSARIEAGLLWFLYVSVYKEAYTCTSAKKDCDSAYAYYTGGEDRSSGKGLAGYMIAMDEKTHNRIWDGLLAVRCWRDLDDEVPAADLEMRDLALKQMDVALLQGMAMIVADRVAGLDSAAGEKKAADWEFGKILGRVLLREAGERDGAAAAVLDAELAKAEPDEDSGDVILSALQTIFPCP